MATGGSWDPTSLPIRPGLYINFVEAALAQITGGARGTVAMPLFEYGSAPAGKFTTIENEKQATDLLGTQHNDAVLRVLQGGAKEVLVYTVPTNADAEQQYIDMRDAFEARPFNVFVYPGEVSATEQDATLAWCQRNRDEGKHFMVVFGGSAADDQDPTIGNARSVRLADLYAVNLITGVVLSDGSELASAEYASYIAGLIAGTPINKSITYTDIPVVDVTKRLRNSEINTALISGSLVLVNDGRKVKVEQGIVTESDATKRGKIRTVRGRQAISTDIPATACDHYIGKVDNNPDGQAALISAIKVYLEQLEIENVLLAPTVKLDPERPSVKDNVFLVVSYVEVDSMERIFLTINV
ncbi:phage tail sheath subtilisin-like domain-containing protein [Heyndrickxia oleronia]|uniref:Phage tail sheath subtilisin-like domain-containing protein n=1 Tax=Heyndrickxia oleronia TaxID=38875 RepID=A0AAW6SM40_9BACI|nr:phage tail sheath subtilisin-like domain-containing protein [Heyndrickxia oleronia]MDH5159821.1 phage tail sheath subtilisin-like domain-containing protein [Heyndrickxia oleronia]